MLRSQSRVFGTLAENPEQLEDLVSDLNTAAGAIASQDSALEASVPALRDTLRVGYPALGELNDALPTLRAFSREAIPGVRSSVPTLDAAIPWIVQARGLVSEDELKGLSADLRQAVPSLVKLNHRLIPALRQLRALSSCTSSVLVPFFESPIPSIEAGNSGQAVRAQVMRSFVGPVRREQDQRREHARVPHPGREPHQPHGRADRAGALRPTRTCRRSTARTSRARPSSRPTWPLPAAQRSIPSSRR